MLPFQSPLQRVVIRGLEPAEARKDTQNGLDLVPLTPWGWNYKPEVNRPLILFRVERNLSPSFLGGKWVNARMKGSRKGAVVFYLFIKERSSE